MFTNTKHFTHLLSSLEVCQMTRDSVFFSEIVYFRLRNNPETIEM